ncbi:MAG TPA: hypothetical protein VLM88_03360 [Proteiniclasticum sp.]|nr:hypothetical protein [Proteiniclasticum sp.]
MKPVQAIVAEWNFREGTGIPEWLLTNGGILPLDMSELPVAMPYSILEQRKSSSVLDTLISQYGTSN